MKQAIRERLLTTPQQLGFTIVPIKRNGLAASSGSTPFDGLFLALSMFVIASALILVSLLFRLTLGRRAGEIGTLLATGFSRAAVARLLIMEMSLVATVGSLLGVLIGIGYAGIMIYGLKTWWLGAISQPILDLKISPMILVIGAVCGLFICVVTIVFTIRSTRKNSIRGLLTGELSVVKKVGWSHQPMAETYHCWSGAVGDWAFDCCRVSGGGTSSWGFYGRWILGVRPLLFGQFTCC